MIAQFQGLIVCMLTLTIFYFPKKNFFLLAFLVFLGGAPTSICHFFCLSVHLSVTHHISGTVHHLVIIFGTRM